MRSGFTTGTCAQAAAKGAGLMLMKRRLIKNVSVTIPSGRTLSLRLINQSIGKDYARCAVIKDSGDDPDVTDGAKICAEVRLSNARGISIKGGKGVGKVTKPGLAVGVGEWAINPTPRKMIEKEINEAAGGKGVEVTISVPGGEELAKKTFNPNLGIVGGISIIGTTGIVEPKSSRAYKVSLSLQLDVLKAQGYNEAVLVLGYVGERYCREIVETQHIASLQNGPIINPSTPLRIDGERNRTIKIGDHIGFMLKECAKKKIENVLLIGHIGKLVKVANGQFNTHCKFGDNRMNSLARYAKLCGAGQKTIADILKETTAEAAVEILRKAGLSAVFARLAKDAAKKCAEFVNNKVRVNCIVLSLNAKPL